MLKLTKKADYGLIAVRYLAEAGRSNARSAKDIAELYGMPAPALAKILQKLAKAKLLVSQHGTNGGYTLAREPQAITAFEVIRAIDGPLFLTSCTSPKGAECSTHARCNVREPLRKVNESIQLVLSNITIADMMEEDAAAPQEDRPEPSELVHLS